MDDENSNFSDFIKFFVPLCHTYNVERRMNIRLVELSCGKWGHHLAATGRIVTKSKLFWLGFEGRLRIVTRIRHEGKVIYSKYYKHWLSTVAHIIDCVCSNVRSENKYTKRSSVLQLRLVYLFLARTLHTYVWISNLKFQSTMNLNSDTQVLKLRTKGMSK